MIRVLVTDDHTIVRSGICEILKTSGDIDVIGEAGKGSELLDLLQGVFADVLLLDLGLPDNGGTELIRRVREMHPTLPILVLSMHDEAQIVTRSLQAGASGYVTKDSEPEILITAIRKVAAGQKYIDPVLANMIAFRTVSGGEGNLDQLSLRELEVLKLLIQGQTINGIATSLHVSPKTVSTHKMRLMKKLGINNNAELIRFALHTGMLTH